MKTQEQRLQETIERVQAFSSSLRQELAHCIERNADSANFMLRDGYVRGRRRGSPWIGSIEHVKAGLSDCGIGVGPRAVSSPAIPRETPQRLTAAVFIICAVILLLVLTLLSTNAVTPAPLVQNESAPKRGRPTSSEVTSAELVPGAAPARDSNSRMTGSTPLNATGAAPAPSDRERLLRELGSFLLGGPLPVTIGEVQITPLSSSAGLVLQQALSRVGIAFGLSAFDDATAGLESIGSARMASSETGLVLSVDTSSPDKTASAIARLLAVTPGCVVGGSEVEVTHRSDGVAEILGPATRVRVHGIDGRIRWGNGEVTLVLARSGVRW